MKSSYNTTDDMNTSSVRSSPNKKRSHDGEIISHPSSATLSSMSGPSTSLFDSAVRQQSPAPSTTSSSLSELTQSTQHPPSAATPSGPESKKRKLTYAEREVARALKREEKEAKEKQKAEEKSRKEEEKRLRDEEKRQKEEEKEAARKAKEFEKAEKKRVKDAEKNAKDAEKSKKEEEKLKRERAQMRIGTFFGRPPAASTPPPSTPGDISSNSSRRSSIAELDMETPLINAGTTPSKNPEYEKYFLPFFLYENTTLAPTNRFLKQKPFLNFGEHDSDFDISKISGQARTIHVKDVISAGPSRKARGLNHFQSVREIVDRLQGISSAPVDLTTDDANAQLQPLKILSRVPVKILMFKEDIRPPYRGTFTRKISPKSAAKVSRNPFHRGLPDTNYDYDSEAEWEAPEEGDEDIDAEDDESDEEGDEEEMGDFLDDEDDVVKRRMLIGEMEPVCSGLCWEGDLPTSHLLAEYRMDVLDDELPFPIDPFSTKYWAKPTKVSPTKLSTQTTPSSNLMQPPRIPLSTLNTPNALLKVVSTTTKLETTRPGDENSSIASISKSRSTDSKKASKVISADLLPAFKQAVAGSDLTKTGLIEILKKQFPKVSKDAIKDTLEAVATRQGSKEVDKRWILNETPFQPLQAPISSGQMSLDGGLKVISATSGLG